MERTGWLIGGGEPQGCSKVRGLLIRACEFVIGIHLGADTNSAPRRESLLALARKEFMSLAAGVGLASSRHRRSLVQDEFFFNDEDQRRMPGRSCRYELSAVSHDPFSRRWVAASAHPAGQKRNSPIHFLRRLLQRDGLLLSPRPTSVFSGRMSLAAVKTSFRRSEPSGIARCLAAAGSLDSACGVSGRMALPTRRFHAQPELWQKDSLPVAPSMQISRFPLHRTKTSHDPSRAGGNRSFSGKN